MSAEGSPDPGRRPSWRQRWQASQEWLSETPLRRLVKHGVTQFSGNSLASVLGLLTLAITTRALVPAVFGVLKLIEVYVRTTESLLSFKSWQAVIKFGSDALEQEDEGRFRLLLKFCYLLDASTALLSALLVAGSVWWIGDLWKWGAEVKWLVVCAAAATITRLTGTCTGVLRMFGRFDRIAQATVANSVVRTVGSLSGLLLGWQLPGFVVIWVLSEQTYNLVLLGASWGELRRRGHLGFFRPSLRGLRAQHPGLLRFMVSTNLTATLRTGLGSFDALLLGGLVGPTAVAYANVSRTLSALLYRFIEPLYSSIYPELTAMAAARDWPSFRGLIVRVTRLISLPSLLWMAVLMGFGAPLLRLASGESYAAAYPVLAGYTVGHAIWFTAFAIPPALLALGGADSLLWIEFAASVLFLAALCWMAKPLGATAAGLAFAFQMALHTTACLLVLRRRLRRQPERVPAEPAAVEAEFGIEP